LGILATGPRARASLRRMAPEVFAALLFLALGFSLVGVALIVAIPLVALVSLGWTILGRFLTTSRRAGLSLAPG
jgi:hypothetical protein